MIYKVLHDKGSHNLSALIYNYLPLCSVHSRSTCLFAFPQTQQAGPSSKCICLAHTFPSFKSHVTCFLWNLSPTTICVLIMLDFDSPGWNKNSRKGIFVFYLLLYLMNEYIVSCRMTKAKGIRNFLMLQDTHLLSATISNTPDTDS